MRKKKKGDRDLEREIKNKGDIFLLEEQHENFVAEVKKWEILAATNTRWKWAVVKKKWTRKRASASKRSRYEGEKLLIFHSRISVTSTTYGTFGNPKTVCYLSCEEALCLGAKIEEREGNGGGGAFRFPPSVPSFPLDQRPVHRLFVTQRLISLGIRPLDHGLFFQLLTWTSSGKSVDTTGKRALK